MRAPERGGISGGHLADAISKEQGESRDSDSRAISESLIHHLQRPPSDLEGEHVDFHKMQAHRNGHSMDRTGQGGEPSMRWREHGANRRSVEARERNAGVEHLAPERSIAGVSVLDGFKEITSPRIHTGPCRALSTRFSLCSPFR
jgi:hypothetical protein